MSSYYVQSEASSRSCVVPSPELAKRIWEEGFFGASTRSTRYKAAFIGRTKSSSSSSRKKNNKQRKYKQWRRRSEETETAGGGAKEADEKDEEERPIPTETVQLSLLEARYLDEKKQVPTVALSTGEPVPPSAFRAAYEGSRLSFDERYANYRLFRDKAQMVPKAGTQYGADFVLYANDPDKCHKQTRKQLILADASGSRALLLKRWVCKHEMASTETEAKRHDSDKAKT